MLGGDMADLRPGCELRQEGQGQVGFCPALEGHLSWSPCSSQQSLNIPLKFLETIPSFKQPHHEHRIQTTRIACPPHGSKLGTRKLEYTSNTQPSPGRKCQEVLTVDYSFASLPLIPLSLLLTPLFLFFSYTFVTPLFSPPLLRTLSLSLSLLWTCLFNLFEYL